MKPRLFAEIADSATDPILTLMERHRRDPRAEKIDLGIGVYRDETGRTPVVAAVKSAELRLHEIQDSKSYVGLTGDPAFLDAFARLALGDTVPNGRLAMVATPGGTGAVRHGLELLRQVRPDATVWLPNPTWPNHPAIADALGLSCRQYTHAAAGTSALDFARMMTDLDAMTPGDLLILHGCCHNPTGLDLTLDQWIEVGALCLRSGAVPFVDLAYLGLGHGLEADAAGLRHLAASLPEMMLAISGSKNFGLYRERVGLLAVLCESGPVSTRVQTSLNRLNRLSYTFPPDHGARVAQMILDDSELRAAWTTALGEMRERLSALRSALAEALIAEGTPVPSIQAGTGLFAQLPLTPTQILDLETQHGIYVIADGRINIAGLSLAQVERVAGGLAHALRK